MLSALQPHGAHHRCEALRSRIEWLSRHATSAAAHTHPTSHNSPTQATLTSLVKIEVAARMQVKAEEFEEKFKEKFEEKLREALTLLENKQSTLSQAAAHVDARSLLRHQLFAGC